MRKIYLVLICLFSLCSTCENDKFNGYDNRLRIKNNSYKDIYVAPFYSYPDTSLNGRGVVPISSSITYKIFANSTEKLSVNCCWENIIDNLPSDTLVIFIFDAQTLETTPWETVKAKYMVLKRYDLSLQDLKSMNWTITYP